MPQGTLFLFAKFPAPGQVKTRLTPLLGAEGAASLASAMLRDLMNRLQEWNPRFPVKRVLCFSPLESKSSFTNWLANSGSNFEWDLHVQCDGDLGARLKHALISANISTKQTDQHAVVFLGMDCIDLPMEAITEAMQRAHTGQATLRPASDGGYVMLCLPQEVSPNIFDNVSWSTAQTSATQIAQAQALKIPMQRIGESDDVDQPEDLKRLWQTVKDQPSIYPNTWPILNALQE